MNETKSVFEVLNAINCNERTEKKNGLTYLSWAWAWAEVKKNYPNAFYTIYENQLPNGYVINYFTDGRTAWVKTGVTIEGLEMVEFLPVMDYKNRSIPVEEVTSFDVNKAIQRSLTKACARHGLGLYIYAGEDLPEGETNARNTHTEKVPTSDGQREAVVAFLDANTAACDFYASKYNVTSLDELTPQQFSAIFWELKKNKKI